MNILERQKIMKCCQRMLPVKVLCRVSVFFVIGLPGLMAGVPEGYLDVTAAPYNADNSGLSDATAALQAAINAGRDNQLAVWLPGGDYLVSDRLVVDQPDNDPNFPVVLVGSTLDPANRARIVLVAGAPGFGDSSSRKAMLHFFNKTENGAPFDGFNEASNADLYNQAVIGVDFKVRAGNDGAVVLRMQGAEGCTIQDVHVDLTEGGHTGIWGIPASGGATHNVTVTGGSIGIDTRKASLSNGGTQPEPVITGSTFINQSDKAVYATVRGSLVMVGCRIERAQAGPVIWLNEHWTGQPFDASLQLVDCEIRYPSYSPENTVIQMGGTGAERSFYLDNTYVRHAHQVYASATPANPSGWIHYNRLALHLWPEARTWGQPAEPVYVDGSEAGDLLLQSTNDLPPPADLQSRHQWDPDFPSWETPGAVNVKALGAVGDGVTDDWAVLQAAIDAHEIVFLPKGTYMVSQTLDLRADSKLIGVHHSLSVIGALSTLNERFAGTTELLGDEPIVRTANVADAETLLGFIQIKRLFPIAQHNPTPPGNYALEWRCAGSSLVRHVKVESRPSNNIRPDLVARNHYGYDLELNPIDPNHPQDSFRPDQWAWCNAEPTVQIRGNGGGRWFTFWMHGRNAMRSHVPFVRVEGTTEPLQIYHLHAQQQDSVNHVEVIGSTNVTIYGTKGELKGTMVYFESCDNVRLFGHSGLSSPNPARNPPWLFRFIDCTNFQISGIGDTIREGASAWYGGAYDRWIHANILTWQPILDQHPDRADVSVPSAHRPILYLRGDPVPGRIEEPPPPGSLVVTINEPANFSSVTVGSSVTFSGSALDATEGDLTGSATWSSSLDGDIGTGTGFSRDDLGVGTHTITFSATNSSGLTITDEVVLNVNGIPQVASTTFTNAGLGAAITTLENWSNGLPDSLANPGTLDLPGTFTVTDPATGATLEGFHVTQVQGALQEGGNLSLEGGGWILDGGSLSAISGQLNIGGGDPGEEQEVTISGGSVFSNGRLSVEAGSTLTMDSGSLSGNEWLLVKGILNLSGGTATFSNNARLQTTSGAVINITGGIHLFSTIRLQDGGPLNVGGDSQVATGNWDVSPAGSWAISFASGSAAALTVAGRDAAWFESRYNAGRLLIDGANTEPFSDAFEVSGEILSLKLSLYDLWTAGHALYGPDADAATDFDQDGLTNLMEYALVGDPTSGANLPVPVSGLTGQTLQISFNRIADPGLNYEVRASGDLNDWGTAPIWSSTGGANAPGPVTVSDVAPLTPASPRFLRVSVSN